MFQNTDISHIGLVGQPKGNASLPSGPFPGNVAQLEEQLQAEMVQQQLLKVQMRAALGRLQNQADPEIQQDEVTTVVLPNGSTIKADMHVK